MKHQALFSSTDKSKNNKRVACCNFAWRFKVRTWETLNGIYAHVILRDHCLHSLDSTVFTFYCMQGYALEKRT